MVVVSPSGAEDAAEVDAQTAQLVDAELQSQVLHVHGAPERSHACLLVGGLVVAAMLAMVVTVAVTTDFPAYMWSNTGSVQHTLIASEVKGPPLCDASIVRQACHELHGGDSTMRGVTTSTQIQDMISGSARSVSVLWDELGLPLTGSEDGGYKVSCAKLCKKLTDFLDKNGVLPPYSNVACYNDAGTTKCDEYVGPDRLRELGIPKDEDLPDYHDMAHGGRRLHAPEFAENQTQARVLGSVLAKETEESIEYKWWEVAERVAEVFRIYPARKPKDEDEDEENEEAEPRTLRFFRGAFDTPEEEVTHGKWPKGTKTLTKKKGVEAKAYMSHAISMFQSKNTKPQMDMWFGTEAFNNKKARKKILKTMNSVLHMISNVHYVPFPSEQGGCGDPGNFYAYVYPEWRTGCSNKKAIKKGCTKTKGGKFVVYLCDLYFDNEHQMIPTLVHEGSHHATSFLDDVRFQGDTAYGRPACKELAKANMDKALDNADSFCYYIQDLNADVSEYYYYSYYD